MNPRPESEKILTRPLPAAKVLIAINTFAALQRDIIRGVLHYARSQAPRWEFEFRKGLEDPISMIARCRHVRGILTHGIFHADGLTAALRRRRIPMVLIETPECHRFPRVLCDNQAISRLAYEHLRSKGFGRFAYLGYESAIFLERGTAFGQAVLADGLELVEPRYVTIDINVERDPTIRRWMVRAPKPLALFVGNVQLARQAVAACKNAGTLVPEEVAVLGVDNEILDCELSTPPLSTIDHGMERAGFEAAALLHRIMDGGAAPAEPILVPPLGVVERQSTDTLAVPDADVRSAVRLIRERATSGLAAKEVLELLPVTRRKLELGFRRYLGRSIHEELTRVKMERAKFLLRTTEMSVPQIALACGFEYASHLSALFAKQIGIPPTVYRRQQAEGQL